MAEGAFHSYEERIDAKKIRGRSESFSDHFSQPALFYRSLADWEKSHVANAYAFELGKCNHDPIKERMLWLIAQIDQDLAKKVAEDLGMSVPSSIEKPINQAIGADAKVKEHQPGKKKNYLDKSPALSQANTKFESIAARKIAVLVADGFRMKDYENVQKLEKEGATLVLIAPHGGTVTCDQNMKHSVGAAIATTESVLFDAVYIPGGSKSIKALQKEAKFTKFLNEAFKHCKAIIADNEGEDLIDGTYIQHHKEDQAVLINEKVAVIKKTIAQHRNWKRMEIAEMVPA
ncbi:MAG: catalase-related domain-containing protein [Tunicatimonas sp.]|uniref:catalase-related domain-containing protein n=1 Tax=Tunicatimonas sp. TaxID=1940096 RepID=UPI003C766E5E